MQIIGGLEKGNEASKTIFVACEEDMEEVMLAVKRGWALLAVIGL